MSYLLILIDAMHVSLSVATHHVIAILFMWYVRGLLLQVGMYRISAPATAGPASGPFWKSGPGPAPVRIVAGFGRIWGSHFGALPSYKQSIIVC